LAVVQRLTIAAEKLQAKLSAAQQAKADRVLNSICREIGCIRGLES